MKKSFMTRVLAASLSTAMAFSLSPVSNLTTASAASTVQISTTFKTVKVGQSATLKLKNNTLDWKISKVTTTDKTICTVYGKTASNVKIKGKSEGRATITIRTTSARRKAKGGVSTKNLKCRANVVAATDNPPAETFGATVGTVTDNSVTVQFSEAVDAATAANFELQGGSASISNVTLSDDKKTATLTLANTGAAVDYTLLTKGLTVGGKAVADQTLKFSIKAPDATTATLTMTHDMSSQYLKSDGASSTVLSCEIKDASGNVMKDAEVEIAFAATRGNLGSTRVAAQNGVAKTTLRSEFLTSTQTSRITATVVESRTNPELINATTTLDIVMTPNPEELAATTGATVTSAESNQADRVTVFFDKEVNVDNYLYSKTKKINRSKAEINVYDQQTNSFNGGQAVAVEGLLPVEGNSSALQIVLGRPLADNTNISVAFRDKTGTRETNNTVHFKLTDARQQAAVKVDNEGYRTIEADFSEAVLSNQAISDAARFISGTSSNHQYAADNGIHFLLDGRPVGDGSNTKYGKASITIGGFNENNSGVDNRDKVTIKLNSVGGKRTYLDKGKHSLQIVNVGDWAALTDGANNIVQTQTLDFEVEENNTLPTIESVVAQSPEQYLVTFNSPVDIGKAKNGMHLAYQKDNSWTNLVYGTDFVITEVPMTGDNEMKQCIVELKRDWTEIFNTLSSKENYYSHPVRITVDQKALENTDNGKENSSEVQYNLTDTVMTTPDVTSPVINDVLQNEDENGTPYYTVQMSEPVKLGQIGANTEGLTPSQTQLNGVVPTPTVSFIKLSDYTTIEGTIHGFDLDNMNGENYQYVLKATPNESLTEGEWMVVVRSISDDVGNTASTLTKNFTPDVTTKDQSFKVLWAAVANEDNFDDDEGAEGIATYNDIICHYNAGPNNDGRYIFVKFSDEIQVAGASQNVLATENYIINGRPMPSNARIFANIKGYDGEDDAVTDSITIQLPSDYKVGGFNSVLNISPAVQSKSGKTLSGDHELRLPYHVTKHSNDIDNADRDSDAVWGNGDDEKVGTMDRVAYTKAVQDALDDISYNKIILTAAVNDLKVTRPVIIDAAGQSINKLTFNYEKGGRSEIVNSESQIANIANLEVNMPNASLYVGDQSGTASTDNITIGKAEVIKIAGNTFKNAARIINIIVTAAKAHIENSGVMETVSVSSDTATLENTKDGQIVKAIITEKATGITIKNAGAISDALIESKGATSIENTVATATIGTTTVAKGAGAVKLSGGKCETVIVNTNATVAIKDAEVKTVDATGADKADVTMNENAKIEAALGTTIKDEATGNNVSEEKVPTIDSKDEANAVKATVEKEVNDFFKAETDSSTTSAQGIELIQKADTTSASAITVTSVAANQKKDGSGDNAVYLTVDTGKIGTDGKYKNSDLNAVVKPSSANVNAETTEYVIVKGTVTVDGKEIPFEKVITVKILKK